MLTPILSSLEQLTLLVSAHVVAQSQAAQRMGEVVATSDPLSNFLQYGVLGLVVIGFATGWIVPGPQAKALAAENTRLSGLIEGKLFPMFEQYAGTMERAAIALEKSAEAMDRQAERERLTLLRRQGRENQAHDDQEGRR